MICIGVEAMFSDKEVPFLIADRELAAEFRTVPFTSRDRYQADNNGLW